MVEGCSGGHPARLSPIALTRNLDDEQWGRLFTATRQTLQLWIDRLQTEIPKLGFTQLTPNSRGPIVAYSYKGAAAKFGPLLDKAKIKVTVSENIMRVSPSVYNDMEDIERLLTALKS